MTDAVAQAVAKAGAEQQAASNPRVSAFVSAHAGTGKTKLLIDRLLRLMLLEGAAPERILCLTFTKAAAAEMANRLQAGLGRWVTLDDAALDAQLLALPVVPDAALRARARALFAQVLDLPGGMRIGTIHAFCQSLLRRFPLEAQVSPHFQLIEPADAREDLEAARERALPRAEPALLAALAGLIGADGFAGLLAVLERAREKLDPALRLAPEALEAAMRRVCKAGARDADAVLRQAVRWPDEAALRGQILLASLHGSRSVRESSAEMLAWLGLPDDEREVAWDDWVSKFQTKAGGPCAASTFAGAPLDRAHPGIRPACVAEQERIEAVQDRLRAIELARVSAALVRLAAPILGGYAQAKELGAMLDYDDLIVRASALLGRGTEWVLFKLDGGLDHLLLDEVQDTAPSQWAIAGKLTGEFFTGAGAHDDERVRTIFAVGDRKQSIYAFQGADPEEFDRWGEIYARRAGEAGQSFRRSVLDVSFRSTAPVLSLVDAVFEGGAAAEGVCEAGETLRHVVRRAGEAGRVELWPLTPRPVAEDAQEWTIPSRNQASVSAPETLARELARWIAEATTARVGFAAAHRPGDVLVLVRRRGDFDRALVRALKAHGVPVAGLDRMELTEQAAVQDLLALCDALLLPQDDLAFAEWLVSPLGGLSDESLMALAAPRRGTLREALSRRAGEQADWADANRFFRHLLGRVDFAAPHALLTEALGALGGRARLYARLGPQAAEPIDELLAASLAYAETHPPSLQGFVYWLRRSGAEVKREAEAAGDTVRVMTLHGAKGLEAPLVILPDTTSLPPNESGIFWTTDSDTGIALPLWSPNKSTFCTAIASLKASADTRQLREHHRLLYVALTRARDRVLVCGWQTHKYEQGNWYELIEQGLRKLEPHAAPFSAWPGEILSVEAPQTAPVEPAHSRARREPKPLPAWAGTAPRWQPAPLPAEPPIPRPLAPSRPDGVEFGPVPAARSPLALRDSPARPLAWGMAMHALLQHLPEIPPPDRAAAAQAFAQSTDLDDADRLANQALALLADPALAPLFGPGSRAEQPLAGLVGDRAISGQVDRLAILPTQILIADYKTRRSPPATPDAVPVAYLRQMEAYRSILRSLYPDRAVTCILIWTETGTAMTLPDRLVGG